MVLGGRSGGHSVASVEVLAADGSGWSALAPMGTARYDPAAVVLPCGKVLAAGGKKTATAADSMLNTAELWDPATGAWSDLPPMAHQRQQAAGCVLPGQPFANRNSILIEVAVRDMAVAMPVALLALPDLTMEMRMQVTVAELCVFPVNYVSVLVAWLLLGLQRWRERRTYLPM